MSNKFNMYYAHEHAQAGWERNEGIDRAVEWLRERERRGWEVNFIDISEWGTDQRNEAYYQTITIAVTKHVGTRRIFGSNRYPGKNFGLEVPALFVLDKEDQIQDVYPHEKDGVLITIWDYLQSLET